MPKSRSWSDDQLTVAVAESYSVRMVILKLGLVPAGGNYSHVTRRISELKLDISHFLGKQWNAGSIRKSDYSGTPLQQLLVDGSNVQSYKLKRKLFRAGLKNQECELCGWAKVSIDGRLPLELDYINGKHSDNRIENLRILCPNCHSLQATHRGKNKRRRFARMVE